MVLGGALKSRLIDYQKQQRMICHTHHSSVNVNAHTGTEGTTRVKNAFPGDYFK